MELLLQQVLAGLATGGIYACMALAVVMIYQAIDHLNFAQGEMAMFSTFIAWQLLAWGVPYWAAFLHHDRNLLRGRGGDRADRLQADPRRAGAQPRRDLHRAVRDPQQPRRLHLGLHHQAVPDAVRHRAAVRQGHRLGPPGRHDRRHAPRPRLPLRVLPLHARRPADACRRRQSAIGPARRHPGRLDDRARLGHGGGDRRHCRHADRAGRVPRSQHDARHPALRLRRGGARRPDEPGRRGRRRLLGRHPREPRRRPTCPTSAAS